MRIEDLADKFPLGRLGRRRPLVSVVPLVGTIGIKGRLRDSFNFMSVAARLERAFSLRGAKAVALAINSPGGSPVQASLIANRIRALSTEKKLPVFAFAEDVAASGGYLLALAADDIYANESSIVGSIGVISAGFGFDQVLEKLGVERRVHTSGPKKAMLDPFQPENPKDVERLKSIQKQVHETFKDFVKQRRGARLNGSARKLFSGEFWAAAQALELGLIDGVGDMRTVMRDQFGDRVKFRYFGAERPWFRSRLGFDGQAPALSPPVGWPEDVLATLDARALWARFGL
ncbi:MAG: S49 family peptidase [Sphingomonadales bacterium]